MESAFGVWGVMSGEKFPKFYEIAFLRTNKIGSFLNFIMESAQKKALLPYILSTK